MPDNMAQPMFTIASDRELDENSSWNHKTGIYINAQDTFGKIKRTDIAQLDKASLFKFLTFFGGSNPMAEDVVGILLGHGRFHEEISKQRTVTPPAPTPTVLQGCVGYFDGVVRGNPGEAACGCVIFDMSGKRVAQRGTYLGSMMNSAAEYHGLISLFKLAQENGITNLYVRGSSQLVVNQMSGMWKVKSDEILPLYIEAQNMRPSKFKIAYVDKSCNKDACRISNIALNDADKLMGN